MEEQKLEQELKPDEYKVLQQGVNQDEQRALQDGVFGPTRAVQEGMQPRYPQWPTSKPGPQATPPPPGMRPINQVRAEQMAEVGYNQELGEPSDTNYLRAMPAPESRQHVSPAQEQQDDMFPRKRPKERL